MFKVAWFTVSSKERISCSLVRSNSKKSRLGRVVSLMYSDTCRALPLGIGYRKFILTSLTPAEVALIQVLSRPVASMSKRFTSFKSGSVRATITTGPAMSSVTPPLKMCL